MPLLRLTILGALLVAATAFGDVETRLRHSDLPRQIGLAGTDDGAVTSQVFIVHMEERSRTPHVSTGGVSIAAPRR